jgi:hypothetical protein
LQLSFEIFRADLDGEIVVAMLSFRILAGSVRDEERIVVSEPEESKIARFEISGSQSISNRRLPYM